MGLMKAILLEEAEKRKMAEEIALKAGVIRECEYHPDTYFLNNPDKKRKAYKIAETRFLKKGDPVSLLTSQKELMDLIDSVVGDYSSFDCPIVKNGRKNKATKFSIR